MAKKNKNLSTKRSSQSPPSPEQILAPEVKATITREVVAIIRQEFSGPLPPPEILAKYNEAVPDGAERLLVMAEKQSSHRRQLEAKVISTDSRNSLLGVVFAFVLGLSTILTGGYVILEGHSYSGAFIGSAGLVGLVSVFVYGTRERRKERESKAKQSN